MNGIKMNQTMQRAMRLMQAGDLRAATEAIQRGLRGVDDAPQAGGHGRLDEPAVLEGTYRHVPDDPDPATDGHQPNPGRHDDEEFRRHRFHGGAGAIDYKLFIPRGLSTEGAPLIVMLHGCTQSPDDFARGTRMNDVAREHGYVVAYPAQPQSKNPSKCWNWFRSHDQQRGQGEPGLIAEMTLDILKRYRVDARRVYVAGLSAGGAMAAVLGGTYPDVYAAIGVHSGLPFGAAYDLPSAFAAMRQGGAGTLRSAPPTLTDSVPAIVFHGDRDTTVHACNGAAVIAQCTEPSASALDTTVEQGSVPNGRTFTRTLFMEPNGRVVAEQWVVHGAGHAWSGGHCSGSYTDPSGPDASEQMVRFFSAFARCPVN